MKDILLCFNGAEVRIMFTEKEGGKYSFISNSHVFNELIRANFRKNSERFIKPAARPYLFDKLERIAAGNRVPKENKEEARVLETIDPKDQCDYVSRLQREFDLLPFNKSQFPFNYGVEVIEKSEEPYVKVSLLFGSEKFEVFAKNKKIGKQVAAKKMLSYLESEMMLASQLNSLLPFLRKD